MVEPARIFDAHMHIIDLAFPLIPNQGYLPDSFTVNDYRHRVENLGVTAGAVVSASFQGFDQQYLLAALSQLGLSFVGIIQLPATATDDEIDFLNGKGVRAVRFNLQRGGSETIEHLKSFADRIYDLAGWHVELYVDAGQLDALYDTLLSLPAVSIDHLGLSKAGLPWLLRLAEYGVRIKASGFGRVDFDVSQTLQQIHAVNPDVLMFGSDLPSTRALRPFADADIDLVIETLGAEAATKVLWDNAARFYRLPD